MVVVYVRHVPDDLEYVTDYLADLDEAMDLANLDYSANSVADLENSVGLVDLVEV